MIKTVIIQDEMAEYLSSICVGYHIFQSSEEFGIQIIMIRFGGILEDTVGGYYSSIDNAKDVAKEFMCFLIHPEKYGQNFRFPKEENGKVMWRIL